MSRTAIRNRLLPVARVCGIAVALMAALPSQAFAHGEQILVYPAATLVLFLVSGLALLVWRESRWLKTVLVVILFGVHASLWFLPITIAELSDAAGRMFLALVALPVGVVILAYVLVRRRRRRGRPDVAA